MPPSLVCGQPWIETVLTCEGDYNDPDLPRKLTVFNNRLHQILQAEKERLVIKKVEPWNSVKVTLNIPPEAAGRLRDLAENGAQSLRSIGILAVQVEGDKVISLTLAGKGIDIPSTPAQGSLTGGHTSYTNVAGTMVHHSSNQSRTVSEELFHDRAAGRTGLGLPAVASSDVYLAPPVESSRSRKRPCQAAGARVGPKKRASACQTTVSCTATACGQQPVAADSAAVGSASSAAVVSAPKPRCRRKPAASIPCAGSLVPSNLSLAVGDAVLQQAITVTKSSTSSRSARGPRTRMISLVGNLQQQQLIPARARTGSLEPTAASAPCANLPPDASSGSPQSATSSIPAHERASHDSFSSAVPFVAAKHLYHPAGEDRHTADRRAACPATVVTAPRGWNITANVSNLLNDSRTEPSICVEERITSGSSPGACADGFGASLLQQQPRCQQPPHTQPAGAAELTAAGLSRDISSHNAAGSVLLPAAAPPAAAGSCSDKTVEPCFRQVSQVAGELLLLHQTLVASSRRPEPEVAVARPIAGSRDGDSRDSRASPAVSSCPASLANVRRHCSSPAVVHHLEGTIVSLSCSGAETTGDSVYDEHVISVGLREAFPSQVDTLYAIPPCLDIAKLSSDQQSQESPMNSPATLAALSKHESSSETETESASAISVDSGVASSSPKSDLGEGGASSAAHTPGGSEHEVPMLSTAVLRSGAVIDSGLVGGGGSSCTTSRREPPATEHAVWVADEQSAPAVPDAASMRAALGSVAGAALLPIEDRAHMRPAQAWPPNNLHSSSQTVCSSSASDVAASTCPVFFTGSCHENLPGTGAAPPLRDDHGNNLGRQALATTCMDRQRMLTLD